MAEAAAAVGLIASIASLIDLSIKVVARLQEYSSKTVDVPQSFSTLLTRLPLLAATLRRVHSQAEASYLPQDVSKALRVVVDNTAEQISIVYVHLSKIFPSSNDSRVGRVFKALKSLPKDGKVQHVIQQIHENIDFLVLHQTTRHVDMGDRILVELARMNATLPTSSVVVASLTSFGTCLGNAPTIDLNAFIGRRKELQQIRKLLSPKASTTRHRIVSIVGMGGMGKTQLSLAYVRDCGSDYKSVFWLNAKDETSLRKSMAELSHVIFPLSIACAVGDVAEERQKIEKVRQWLSVTGNDQWLLVFDNYDNPDIPGARSPTGYDIRRFFPISSQGSILITSRSTRLAFSTQLKLQKIKDDETSVAILSQRCGRDVSADNGVFDLVHRLGGLPLALATAGGFLCSSTMSCVEYLRLYESAWMNLMGPDNEELLEYEARNLSSTWTVSLDRIRHQDADAAELLTFFAYFGNNDIWYELIKRGASDDVPWLNRVTQSKIGFQRTMSTLVGYSLVDVVAGSYQIHPCLHDWLFESLNNPPKLQLFNTALKCVAETIHHEEEVLDFSNRRRFFEHIKHLDSSRFNALWDVNSLDQRVHSAANRFGRFDSLWGMYDRSERMFDRAIQGRTRALGPEHPSTLETIGSLGMLYFMQGKMNEAEFAYHQALEGFEKALGREDFLTLSAAYQLSLLYRAQGKSDQAEDMLLRVQKSLPKSLPKSHEKRLGLDNRLTLNTLLGLGLLYQKQGRLDQAEDMIQQALNEHEKVLGFEHPSTLSAARALGGVYRAQGKVDQAEDMLLRALSGSEKIWGPEHPATLKVVTTLGVLYEEQGKTDKAEQMFKRADGREGTLQSREMLGCDEVSYFDLEPG